MADVFAISIDKLVGKKDKEVLIAENDLVDNFDNIEKKIFDAVKKKINTMNVEGGKILFDDTNTAIVNEIDAVIQNALQGSNYPTQVKEFLRSFETIKQFNFDAQKSVNDISEKELSDLIDPIQKANVEQTLNGLTGTGVSTNFIQPVREGIYKNIVAGTTISDLETYLTNYIISNPERMSGLKRYVTQVSRDSLNQFDGQVNSKIAETFGLDAFRYVGSLIDDSRPQCVRWVGKNVLLLDELQNELNWAYNNGTGMIPGTTPNNFAVFRGGYNCRHSAIPFKLTKSQRAELGIQQTEQQVETNQKVDQQIKEVESKTNEILNKQFEKPKNELNSDFVATTYSPTIQKSFFGIINEHDGSAEIANKNQTIIGLLNDKEYSNPSSSSNSDLWKNKEQINPKQIANLKWDENGICYTDNKKLSIKLLEGQKIEGRNYSNDIEVVSKSTYNGGKVFSMSSVSRIVDKNVAPTITHEFSHLIHNEVDPMKQVFFKGDPSGRVKMKEIMKKLKIKLTDSPTVYGQSNHSEFFAESLTAYVYAPEWLKENHPKALNLLEVLFDEYKIDKKTIKQYFKNDN